MPTQPVTTNDSETPLIQKLVALFWPSFIAGLATTVVFFSLFDPVELTLLIGFADVPPLGGYTIGFFFFWLAAALSSALTLYFARPCNRGK